MCRVHTESSGAHPPSGTSSMPHRAGTPPVSHSTLSPRHTSLPPRWAGGRGGKGSTRLDRSSLVVAVMNLRNSSPHVLRVIVHVQNVDEPSWFLRTCSENQVSCFGVSRLPAYRQQRYFRTLESAPNSPEVCGMRSWAFQNWLILGNHHMGGTWGLQPWEHDLPKSFGGSVASGFPAA